MDLVKNNSVAVTGLVGDRPSLMSWPAILAGAAIAIGSQIALSQLCLGLGLSLWNIEGQAATIAFGTALVWVLSGLVSLFLGGWVAGRLARRSQASESIVHGAVTWSLTAVVGAVLAVTVAGALAGSTALIVGKGVGAVTEVAKAVAPTWDTVKAEVSAASDRIDSKPADASGSATPGGDSRMADRGRLMELMGKGFETDGTTDLSSQDKDELVALLASQTGTSKESAAKAYAQWQKQWLSALDKYEAAKAKALDVARDAKSYAAQAAMWAFIAMLLGVIATTWGSFLGGRSAPQRFVGTTDYQAGMSPTPRATARTS